MTFRAGAEGSRGFCADARVLVQAGVLVQSHIIRHHKDRPGARAVLVGQSGEVMNSFVPPSPSPYLVEKNSLGSVVLTPRQEPSWHAANFHPHNSRNSVIWQPSGAKSSPVAPSATTAPDWTST